MSEFIVNLHIEINIHKMTFINPFSTIKTGLNPILSHVRRILKGVGKKITYKTIDETEDAYRLILTVENCKDVFCLHCRLLEDIIKDLKGLKLAAKVSLTEQMITKRNKDYFKHPKIEHIEYTF